MKRVGFYGITIRLNTYKEVVYMLVYSKLAINIPIATQN